MIKSIVKRIIVSVGVILCLGFLSKNFGIGFIQVNAQTNNDIPIDVFLNPNANHNLVNKDGVISNIFDDDSEIVQDVNMFVFVIDPNSCSDEYGCATKNSPYPNYYSFGLDNNIELPNSEYSNTYGYVGSIYWSFTPTMEISNNNHYTFFYLLTKLNNTIRYNSNLDDYNNLPYDIGSINVSKKNVLSETDISESIFNLTSEIRPMTIDTNGTQSSYLTIAINFDTGDNFSDLFNDDSVYLSSIHIDINSPNYYVSVPINFLLSYPSTGSTKSLSQNTYFIENGEVLFTGVDCNDYFCSSDSGNRFDGMDRVSTSDIEIINGIPQCEDGDVICHIRRVFELISRFFIRFGNWFQESLAPKDNMTLAQVFFNTFHLDDGGLSSVITAPLGVIENINANACQSITFSMPHIGNITFPCLKSSVYSNFSAVLTAYQTITTGAICYLCLMSIFNKIRSLQNPDTTDKIEVMNL